MITAPSSEDLPLVPARHRSKRRHIGLLLLTMGVVVVPNIVSLLADLIEGH